MIIIDTTYQRGIILVEELRKLYTQLILFSGLFIFIIIRNLFLNTSSFYEPSMDSQVVNFIQNPLFIISYVGVLFTLMLLFRYLKFYLLKRNFNNQDKANNKLKKYMKSNDIPTKEDVLNKFIGDKNKVKKKFKFQLVYILSIITLLIIVNMYYMKILFLDLIIIFMAFNLFYRHLSIYHFDKKFFNQDWEDKHLKEYINEFKT